MPRKLKSVTVCATWLAVNSGCAPQRVRFCQGSNQHPNLNADRRAPGFSRFLGQMAPVPAEPLALPAYYRVGMDHDQGSSPVFPQQGQRDPEPAVTIREARMLVLAFVNGELLPKGEIF
jgi:hypothetical protein